MRDCFGDPAVEFGSVEEAYRLCYGTLRERIDGSLAEAGVSQRDFRRLVCLRASPGLRNIRQTPIWYCNLSLSIGALRVCEPFGILCIEFQGAEASIQDDRVRKKGEYDIRFLIAMLVLLARFQCFLFWSSFGECFYGGRCENSRIYRRRGVVWSSSLRRSCN